MHVLFADEVDHLVEGADREDRAASCPLQTLEAGDPLPAHYDLTLGHPLHDVAFAVFDRWLGEAAAAHGLRCALLHEGVASEAALRLGQGQLHVSCHLDCFAQWHQPEDPSARLCQAVEDAGGNVVNSPARARLFMDRAAAHKELRRRGLGVPETVVLRPWLVDQTAAVAWQRLRLDEPGSSVTVRPANGCGGQGIVHPEQAEPDRLAALLAQDRQDTLLIQRAVRCPWLECADGVERPASWRILCCLDELIPFWWSASGSGTAGPSLRWMTRSEAARHRLRPVLAFAAEWARLCGLHWFSMDLCLSEGAESSRHQVRGENGRVWPVVALDACNAPHHAGVPAAVVRHQAWRLAEAAWLCRQPAPSPWAA